MSLPANPHLPKEKQMEPKIADFILERIISCDWNSTNNLAEITSPASIIGIVLKLKFCPQSTPGIQLNITLTINCIYNLQIPNESISVDHVGMSLKPCDLVERVWYLSLLDELSLI